MELEEEQYEDMQSSEEQYEDMQSPVRQYQGAYCEVVKTTPRRQVSSSIKKQDSLGAPPLPPRTHDVTEGGILVLDPPPHFKIANQPKQTETPPPLYEYLPESEADRASELQLSMRTLPILPSVYDDQPKLDTNFKCPIGYDIMSLLSQGNVIFIMPKTSVKRQPLYINHTLGGYSERIVQGGGAFTDESKFMVSIPRAHKSELMITLESLKYKGRYLCIDRRGRIKARNGYKDSCDFFVYGVSGSPHLVYFESARSDGFYFGMRSDNSPSDAASITADSEEAHFGILTDNISESFRAPKLTVFGTNSIMEQVRDKSVIRLFSQRRYLGIDRKGRVVQTHNDKNTDSWFVVHDRGMGILSLRSYAHTEYWLKIQDGQPQRKGKPGLDTFFKLRESVEHQIILESIAQPGTYIFPTSRNTLSMSPTGTSPSMTPEFTLEIISEKKS